MRAVAVDLKRRQVGIVDTSDPARWPGPLGDVISGHHPMDDYVGLVTGEAGGIKDVIAVGR